MSSKKKSSPEQAEPDQLTPTEIESLRTVIAACRDRIEALECWVVSHGMQLPADTDAAAALRRRSAAGRVLETPAERLATDLARP